MKRKSCVRSFIGILCTIVICACSSGGEKESSTSALARHTAPATIGSDGGIIVTSDGNITLNIPANALGSNTTIDMSEGTEGDPPGAISSSYSFTPDGLTFNSDVTVSVKYDPALIPKSINETDLQLAYAQNGNWIPLTNSIVDTTNHVISAPTNHFTPYAGTCGTYTPYNKNGPALGNLNGVDVYSNGFPKNDSGDYNKYDDIDTGLKWQCVEFINRYYLQKYGQNIRIAGDDANDYYKKAQERGLDSYENNNTVTPQPGDIIVSEGTSGNIGHVAIVKDVFADYITVAQQNWCENIGDLEFVLSRDGNNIGSFGGGKSYPIKGWLRLSVSGTWYGNWQHATDDVIPITDRWGDVIITLDRNGNTLSGTVTMESASGCPYDPPISVNLSGSIANNSITLSTTGGDFIIDLNGTQNGNIMSGNYAISGGTRDGESGTWEIEKVTTPTIEPWGAILLSAGSSITLKALGGVPPYTITSNDAQNAYDSAAGDGSWTVAENGGTFIVHSANTASDVTVSLTIHDSNGTKGRYPSTLYIN